MKFIQHMFYRAKVVEKFVELEWDNTMKLKRKQRKSFYLIETV